MNTHNYPAWLVPLEIAKELKEIGYKEDCYFEFSKDDGLTLETLERESCIIGIDELLSCTNKYWQNVSVPTYEQVLTWFRAKGYKITFKDINIGTQCAFYHLDIKEGHTFSHFAKKYEKAREGLVMKLIEVHKEFGNNIKRFDNEASYINPNVSTISSIGDFVEESSRQAAAYSRRELVQYVSKDSLAFKILTENLKDFFTEKQVWVIAYELQKNAEYVAKLQAELEVRERRAEAKAEASKAKLNANKEASQEVLDFVKSNKKLLKDYYAFVKANKKYSKEYYSKKFTLESATEFVNL